MLYFLEKAGKIAAALGALPQPPVGLRRLTRKLRYFHPIYVLFLNNAQISRHRKNYDLLSHAWATVSGPLSQVCPPPLGSNL